jgi:predicted anti-sigma-YlaC factor YlaD
VPVRTFLIALGLATILLGLFLLFAGYVGVGCSVGGTSANPTVSNCGGATELEVGGAVLTAAAVLMLAGAFVPERSTGSQ